MSIRHNRFMWEHNRIVSSFQQFDGETVEEAWMRMKDMLNDCYCHSLDMEEIIKTFYCGLNDNSQDILEFSSEKPFMYNSANQAFQILEDKLLPYLNRSTESYPPSNPDPYPENPNCYQNDPWTENQNSFENNSWNENSNYFQNEFRNETFTPYQEDHSPENPNYQSSNQCQNEQMDSLQSDIQITNPPVSEPDLPLPTWNEYISDDDDVIILSDNTDYVKVKDTGITDHVLLVPEPVEDDWTDYETDDEIVDEEVVMIPEPVKNDDTLDNELEELLSSDLEENVDNKIGEITAEEFNEILEMSIDEFEQLMENPPVDESYEESITPLEVSPTYLEFTPLPSNLECALLQGESLLPVVISSLLPVMIQAISNVIVVSVTIQIYNEMVSRKRKLEGALATFLTDKCSSFEKGVIKDWVIKNDKVEDYSPFNFRPPDVLRIEISEIPPDLKNDHFEPLKLPFSKKNDCFKLHIPFKKLKGFVYHVPRPPDQNKFLCHLWLSNLFADSTHHHCHPHLNSSVGESPLIPCK